MDKETESHNLLVLRRENKEKVRKEKEKFEEQQKIIGEWRKIFATVDIQTQMYNDVKAVYESLKRVIIFYDDDDKINDLVEKIKLNRALVHRSSFIYEAFGELLLRLS